MYFVAGLAPKFTSDIFAIDRMEAKRKDICSLRWLKHSFSVRKFSTVNIHTMSYSADSYDLFFLRLALFSLTKRLLRLLLAIDFQDFFFLAQNIIFLSVAFAHYKIQLFPFLPSSFSCLPFLIQAIMQLQLCK